VRRLVSKNLGPVFDKEVRRTQRGDCRQGGGEAHLGEELPGPEVIVLQDGPGQGPAWAGGDRPPVAPWGGDLPPRAPWRGSAQAGGVEGGGRGRGQGRRRAIEDGSDLGVPIQNLGRVKLSFYPFSPGREQSPNVL
jgi:hypothetical protein